MNEDHVLKSLRKDCIQAVLVGTIVGAVLVCVALLLCRWGIAFGKIYCASTRSGTGGRSDEGIGLFLFFMVVAAPLGCLGAAIKLFRWAGRAFRADPPTAVRTALLLQAAGGRMPVGEVPRRLGLAPARWRRSIEFFDMLNTHQAPGTTLDNLPVTAVSLRSSWMLEAERK